VEEGVIKALSEFGAAGLMGLALVFLFWKAMPAMASRYGDEMRAQREQFIAEGNAERKDYMETVKMLQMEQSQARREFLEGASRQAAAVEKMADAIHELSRKG
jgi:hypothetical protein